MAHSPSHTTSKKLAIVEVIRRDNTRFRRRIGVEQSTHRQQLTEFSHIRGCHWCCPRLNEVHLLCHLLQLLSPQSDEHSDGSRDKERCNLPLRTVYNIEECFDILHSVDDMDGSSDVNRWVNLRQTTDMIQRTVDDKRHIRAESL